MDIKVDSLNGIDQSESTLFKTLDYALDSITNSTDNIINVYLLEGDYILTLHDALFNKNKIVNIKGKNHKTNITQTQGFYSNNNGGSSLFILNIYNLIYNMVSNITYNWNAFKFKWNFYNVVFNNIPNAMTFGGSYTGIFYPQSTTVTINNCTKANNSEGFLRTDNGKIFVKNSYGSFTSGYSTKQSSWDIENNIITTTPKLDSKYKITDSNINNNSYGVYSDVYSWNIMKYILKNNNHYYTIKPEYYLYDIDSYSMISQLEGKFKLEKIDYDTYGFDKLHSLTQDTSINLKTFKPIDVLQKQFDNIEILRMEEK